MYEFGSTVYKSNDDKSDAGALALNKYFKKHS